MGVSCYNILLHRLENQYISMYWGHFFSHHLRISSKYHLRSCKVYISIHDMAGWRFPWSKGGIAMFIHLFSRLSPFTKTLQPTWDDPPWRVSRQEIPIHEASWDSPAHIAINVMRTSHAIRSTCLRAEARSTWFRLVMGDPLSVGRLISRKIPSRNGWWTGAPTILGNPIYFNWVKTCWKENPAFTKNNRTHWNWAFQKDFQSQFWDDWDGVHIPNMKSICWAMRCVRIWNHLGIRWMVLTVTPHHHILGYARKFWSNMNPLSILTTNFQDFTPFIPLYSIHSIHSSSFDYRSTDGKIPGFPSVDFPLKLIQKSASTGCAPPFDGGFRCKRHLRHVQIRKCFANLKTYNLDETINISLTFNFAKWVNFN